MSKRAPRFSVIVTTYNRQALLERCLASLLVQEFPRDDYEIIVVDDGSQDTTPGLLVTLAREGQIRYLHQENCGWSMARNSGVARSQGEIVVFTDDDCRVPFDWLARYEAAYEAHPEFDGIAGSIASADGANLAGRIRYQVHLETFDLMNAPLGVNHDTPGEVIFCFGANRSFRRTAFSRSTFDVNLLYFDDFDVNLQLREQGIRIYYQPSIQVTHHYVLGARDRILADYRFGLSAVSFERKYPQHRYERPARGSLTRLREEYRAEPWRVKASYVGVQAVCRLARHWGRWMGAWKLRRGKCDL
jgi:glycosyltransferase involved in cell wall biosynthesis